MQVKSFLLIQKVKAKAIARYVTHWKRVVGIEVDLTTPRYVLGVAWVALHGAR